ncbi:MAG: hypothetical protein QOH29_1887 [Actinomycetota bacterium]|nr:hypothetical protein [Actinomycetota bacterium]
MDDGPTAGRPGNPLASVWVNLTPDEALELLHALLDWADAIDAGEADPGWHTHITDTEGRELTVAIAEEDEQRLHEHHQ